MLGQLQELIDEFLRCPELNQAPFKVFFRARDLSRSVFRIRCAGWLTALPISILQAANYSFVVQYITHPLRQHNASWLFPDTGL